MTQTRLFECYEAAYAAFDEATPLPADCGKLCHRRCCKGGSDDGMLLFPGEAEFLDGQQRFLKIRRVAWRDGTEADFAVCRGRCRREWRPLSCRIFPFAPTLTADGEVRVIADPRALPFCPLLDEAAAPYLDQNFLRTVQTVFQDLLVLDGFPAFLGRYGAMLADYARFTGGKE